MNFGPCANALTPVESKVLALIRDSDPRMWKEVIDSTLDDNSGKCWHDFHITDGTSAATVRCSFVAVASYPSIYPPLSMVERGGFTDYSISDLKGIDGNASEAFSPKLIWEAAAVRFEPLRAQIRQEMRSLLAEVTLNPCMIEWQKGKGRDTYVGEYGSFSLEIRRIRESIFGFKKDHYLLSVKLSSEATPLCEKVEGDRAKSVFNSAALQAVL